MRLKKSKEEALRAIKNAARLAAQNSINTSTRVQVQVDSNSLIYAIQDAIGDAVTEAFETLLDLQYTDDDFEQDMQLK